MTFSKVSVLVPTRKRLLFLERMLESFEQTVGDPDQAELVFRCDGDDKESIDRLCAGGYKMLIGPRKEGYRSLPGFYNEMARIATGDVLMCCNDDVVFQTPSWPAIILEESRKYPDGIFNFGVDVGLNNDKFPFSIVSRRLVEILGFINDERLLFSDVFLLDVAKHFNRAIPLPSVRIFHDWAGHGSDQTRIEANRHERTIVFKDDQGNWTDEYRALHELAVAEAVETIKRRSDLAVDLAVNSLFAYQPPAETGAGGIWPPRVSCRSWYSRTAPNAIHYPEQATRRLLRLIYQMNLDAGDILLSSHNNGLASILWGSVFSKVVSILHAETPSEPIGDGRFVIMPGPVGYTPFLYKVADQVPKLKVLLLDDSLYSNIISVYFLLRGLINPPGLVVFTNTGNKHPSHAGVCRFLGDLARGHLDNRRHLILCLDQDDPHSPGVSYEQIEPVEGDSAPEGPPTNWKGLLVPRLLRGTH